MGFSSDLWDAFETVYKRVQDGKKFCTAVNQFIKKRSELEKEYAKKLSALCKSTEVEIGSLNTAWCEIKNETESISKFHMQFGEELVAQVHDPIDQMLKSQVKTRRALRDTGRRVLKELGNAESNHTKAKKRFEECRKKQDESQDQYEKESFSNANSDKAKKLAKQVAADSKRSTEADHQYMEAVNSLKTHQEKAYDSELPKVLDDLEDLESSRMSSMKSFFEKYSELQARIPPEMQQSCAKIQSSVGAVNVRNDLDNYISQTKTGRNKPPKAEYEPYDSKLGACKPAPGSGPSYDDSTRMDSTHRKNQSISSLSIPSSTPSSTTVSPHTSTYFPPSQAPDHSHPPQGSSHEYIGKARALFDYTAQDEGELNFKEGDTINIILKDPSGWWQGELNGNIGVFPSVDWVQEITGAPSAAPPPAGSGGALGKCRALYTYNAEADYELTINEGEELSVDSEQDGWYFGSNSRGDSGKFPSNYVEMI